MLARAVRLLSMVCTEGQNAMLFVEMFDSRLGVAGLPSLTLFFWVNGAPFEDIVNGYNSAGFPVGIDPRNPLGMFNGSAGLGNNSSTALYSAYPQNLDGYNSSRTRLDGVAAPVDSS